MTSFFRGEDDDRFTGVLVAASMGDWWAYGPGIWGSVWPWEFGGVVYGCCARDMTAVIVTVDYLTNSRRDLRARGRVL